MDSPLEMFLCLGSGLTRVDQGAKETPSAPARHLSSGRVASVHPIRVGELGRVLCRSLGELGDANFKLPIVFLAAPSADEAVPRLPEVQEVVVHLRRGLR